ncbi:type II secretion system protein GspM [Methylobacterium sp. Leaf93]|uniref:type II secretion system protein GspM n=1 Tax=Methylobacterium sp. Leaf93 TaxID=1736249 RepID=UPI0006FEBB7D|nr:type II secretion system protein GspM [Methylobacterium sp. Leaf93]KQP15361.1 hypothetical protein ASF26_16620 [Methylobacterium sp. Leaf93]
MSDAVPRGLARPDIRRAAALLVFLGLPVLFGGIAVTALVQARTQSGETTAKADLLAQIRAQMKARLSGRAALRDPAPLYLASPSASLARAELLSLLGRLIDEAEGRLVETQMAPEEGNGPSERIALQTTLDIGNDGLADLLHAIETGLPVLNVDEVTVVRAMRAERSDPVTLRVTLVIHGYWKAKAI